MSRQLMLTIVVAAACVVVAAADFECFVDGQCTRNLFYETFSAVIYGLNFN
jgi:hypothetical protein